MSRLTSWMNRTAFSYEGKPYYVRNNGEGELQLYQGSDNGGELLAIKKEDGKRITLFGGGDKADMTMYKQMFDIDAGKPNKLGVEDLLKRNCVHPFKRLHWVGNTVYCNQCGTTLRK